MCGIVGAIAQRPIAEVLLFGLKALEYRGYDSAGVSFLNNGAFVLCRSVGKVSALENLINERQANGIMGIAHTRWATHGKPEERNAHPHNVGSISLVHNGIIENYQEIKEELCKVGYSFKSDTDTEVFAALIDSIQKRLCQENPHTALSDIMAKTLDEATHAVKGSYAIGVMHVQDADHLYLARHGSPLVVGLGIGENFIASDVLALLPVTSRFIYLEDGDYGVLSRDEVQIFNAEGIKVNHEIHTVGVTESMLGKGGFKHYMEKEIFEQPEAIANTLKERLDESDVSADAFKSWSLNNKNTASKDTVSSENAASSRDAASSENFKTCLSKIEHVEIVACGTSYHAGLVGSYFMEQYAGVSCRVTIASEYRYKRTIVPKNSLFVTISQSGETADTLAALKLSRTQGYAHSLCICNVENSSLVRESQFYFLTRAGAEIGVASTKAFTTQLVALNMLVLALGRAKGEIDHDLGKRLVKSLNDTPQSVAHALLVSKNMDKDLAEQFVNKDHALFLGRGPMFPIALEGALKLKEISYIHAEGYASGELKHGPIALIDNNMPVIVVAPDNKWLSKLISNIEEVRARGGHLFIFGGNEAASYGDKAFVMNFGAIDDFTSPIVFTVPLQLLAYHVAVIKGTDVDQPRNLAKSVTVE